MDIKTVGVVGLGLIGGSIARALKEKLNIDVIGIDINKEYVDEALASKTIIKGTTNYNDLADCDIIFLCLPVKESIRAAAGIINIAKPGCIITDVGSTKEEIMEFAETLPENIHFIGGHPMTGSEKSGFSVSKAHLFENAYYILTPKTGCSEESVNTLTELVKGIGALPIVLDSKEHDMITAAISHVPHVIASGLVNIVKKLDGSDKYMHKLAAGGFKDITRIASGSPVMWQNICFTNSKNVCKIIDEYINHLADFKKMIVSDSQKGVFDFFEEAKVYRDSFPAINRGPIEPLYNIAVDVKDEPGIIGEVATILGKHEINIKNIGISNSREFQAGALVISFNSKEHMDKAVDILKECGYTVGK